MTLSAANSSRSWCSSSRFLARARPRWPWPRSTSSSRTNAPSARPSSIGRPRPSPCQNGILPGTPGAGETTTRSGRISSTRQLVAHLLVQLADAPPRRARLADEEYRVEAAVRDRATARDRDRSGVSPPFHQARLAVPQDARLEIGELVGRIRPGQHPQYGLEGVARQALV